MSKEKYSFEKIKEEYDKKYNEGLKAAGIFWTFSKEQFHANKTHKDALDDEYLYFGSGGYYHKSNEEKVKSFFNEKLPILEKEFIDKIKMEDLIEYELINHECYLTGDFSEVIDIVQNYYKDISIDDIYDKVKNVYNSTKGDIYSDIDNGSIGI